GESVAAHNPAWGRTLSDDTPPPLPVDRVRYVGQEVAVVVADNPYVARDGCAAIEVDYEPLPAVLDPFEATDPGAPLVRDDKPGQADNVCYRWEIGDAEETYRAFD